MYSISSRWLRRLILKIRRKRSALRHKRRAVRNLILENLEPRSLMSGSPWAIPVIPTQTPDAGAPVQRFPGSLPSDPFFGPREKVWISEFQPTSESGPAASFRIERSNSFPALEVSFNVLADSTAQKDVDYVDFKTRVLFEPGQTYVDVPITPIDDSLVEPTETIRIVLWDTSRIGTWVPPDITSIQISDDDFSNTGTSVELLPPIDGQEAIRDGRLRARRTGSLAEPLSVNYELSLQENLIYGEDFLIDTSSWSRSSQLGQFVFLAGESLTSVPVSVIDDLVPENTEWMDVRLIPDTNSRYQIAGKQIQTLRILDNDGNSKSGDNRPLLTMVLSLLSDTGISSTDRVTWDERLVVSVEGKQGTGLLKTQFDWNGDFIPDATLTVDQLPSSLVLDPRSFDPSLAGKLGSRSVRYRSNVYAKNGVLVEQSAWSTFDYRVVSDPDQGPLRLENLQLKIDTDNASDRVTTNPSVEVSICGEYPDSSTSASKIRIQWDQNQDGVADYSSVLEHNQRFAQYDPRLIDPDYAQLPGSRTIRVQLVDEHTQSPLTAWQSIEFTIPSPVMIQWMVAEVSHSNPIETPREWILRGRVIDPSNPATSPFASALDDDDALWVQIDTDQDDQPDTSIPIDRDMSFEYVFENLGPGRHVFKLRVQQWSSKASMMVAGAWMQYDFTIDPSVPVALPTLRLRNDTGASATDRITADPTICIEVPVEGLIQGRIQGLTMLDIESDTFVRAIPVPRSIDDRPRLVVFQDESITVGPQRYRVRTRVIDPTSGRESQSDWVEFSWTYQPEVLPAITLGLLSDDGISNTDRITSIATVVGQIVMGSEDVGADAMGIQIDWDSDGSIDAWTQPMSDGRFAIRPDRDAMGHRSVSARLHWTDPYRNISLVGNWTALNFQLAEPPSDSSEISGLSLWIDTGRSQVDRISSVSTIQGVVVGSEYRQRVQIDRRGDRIVDDEVSIDSTGRFRYTPMALSYGSHVFYFRSMGLNENGDAIRYSSWQPFDFTYVASTMEPVVIDSLKLVNDSGKAGDNRSEQGSVMGRLTSFSGIESTLVLVDVDQDRQADATLTVKPDGRFIYDPGWISQGQHTVSFRPLRIAPLQLQDSTPDRWTDLTFVIEDQPDTAAALYAVEVGSIEESGNASLRGSVRSQRSAEGVLVELDSNGDGLADRTAKVNSYAEFSFDLQNLAPGEYLYRIRAMSRGVNEEANLVGSWQSVPFRIDGDTTIAAKITDFRLKIDDGFRDDDHVTSDPGVSGKVDRNSVDSVVEVEFDFTGDSLPDDSLQVAEDLTFEYVPTRLEIGTFRLQARTKEVLSSGRVLRGQWTEVRGTLVSKNGNSDAGQRVAMDHEKAIAQAIAKLAQDRHANTIQSELDNELSLQDRSSGMLDASEANWTHTASSTIEFAQERSEAIEALREKLRAIDSVEVDLPLPEELAILWPSDLLPNLPFDAQQWLPRHETLPVPPVQPPGQAAQGTAAQVHWTGSLTEAFEGDALADQGLDLSHHSEYQDSLQRIRSDLLAEFRFAEQQARIAKNRAQRLYELLVAEAQALYREAMTKNGSEFTSLSLEDYSEIYEQFAENSRVALASYQSERNKVEDQYRLVSQQLSDASLEKIRTLQRNRDEKINQANRELASVLNTVPPPEEETAKAALLAYAKKTYDAHFHYEQDLLQIQSLQHTESYKLQHDQMNELSAIELGYAERTAELERLRDRSIAEYRYQQSARRASLANRWDAADELASHQLHLALTNAWAELERSLIQVEADRRISNDLGLQQFDFMRASLACVMLTRVDSLVLSPETRYELERGQQYLELLRELKPHQEQYTKESVGQWKIDALAKIDAEQTKRLGALVAAHVQRMERIEAVHDFRMGHARMVRSYAFELIDIQRDAVVQIRNARQTQRLDSGLSGITYLKEESTIAYQYRQRFLDALVYEPPKLEHWTGGWGWIDGNFLGAVSGSATISPQTSYQLVLDEQTATANLVYKTELRRIGIDQVFFARRDGIEADFRPIFQEHADEGASSEFQLLKRFHWTTAQSDRKHAVALVDGNADYDASLARAAAHYHTSASALALQNHILKSGLWVDHEQHFHQMQVELTTRKWDQYLSQMQRWRDSEPSPWTDYLIEQARLARSQNVQRSQILLEKAQQESLQKSADQLLLKQLGNQFLVRSSSVELQTAEDQVAATRQLGRALAEAKFALAEQTAGAVQVQLFGIHFPKKSLQVPNLFDLKNEAAKVTAAADTSLADAQLSASLQRADAKYRRSLALSTLWSEFDRGELDWDRYYERVSLVERIYSDRLQQIDGEHFQERKLTDEALRTERGEIVRLAAIEQELARPIEARWAWLEDLPKLSNHSDAYEEYARSIQSAHYRFAEQSGLLQFARQEALAQIEYQREVDLGRVRDTTTERQGLWDQSQQLAFLQIEHDSGIQEQGLQNSYQQRVLQQYSEVIDAMYRKLDPETRVLLKHQMESVYEQHTNICNANLWKQQVQSDQTMDYESDRIAKDRIYAEQLSQLQTEYEQREATSRRDTKIDQARRQTQWMIAVQKNASELEKSEALVKVAYDRRSDEALRQLNQKMLEQRRSSAKSIGEIWKNYYLRMHPDSMPLHASLRSELDNWMGLRVSTNPWTSGLWRLEPMADRGGSSFAGESASEQLRGRLVQLQEMQEINRADFQVAFAKELGIAKVSRIEELAGHQQSNHQADIRADQVHAQADYSSSRSNQIQAQESRMRWIDSKDRLELARIQEQNAKAIQSLEHSQEVQRQFQQKVQQASIQSQRDWAGIQGNYHINAALKQADMLRGAAQDGLRSQALIAHAIAYAQWIHDVAPDYTDWIVRRGLAQGEHAQRLLEFEQQRELAQEKAQDEHMLQSERVERSSQRLQSQIAFDSHIALTEQNQVATEKQRQIDLEYRSSVLGSESTFLQEIERAETSVQIMKMRGYSVFDQALEKSRLSSTAGHKQALEDSAAMLVWSNSTAQGAIEHDLWEIQQNTHLRVQVQRIDAQRQREILENDQTRDEAIVQARLEYQVQMLGSEDVLARKGSEVQFQWLVEAAQARLVARQQLQEAIPSDWSSLMLAMAEHEFESIPSLKQIDARWIDGRGQIEYRYVTTTANAQLHQERQRQQADRAYLESQIQQELGSLESFARIDLNYQTEIHDSAREAIEQIHRSLKTCHEEIAQAELAYHQDLNSTLYQQRIEQAQQAHANRSKQWIEGWNRHRIDALVVKQAADSDLHRADSLGLVENESQRAWKIRDSKRELIRKEADAYEVSKLGWSELQKDNSNQIAFVEMQMAEQIDQQLGNEWSSFLVDVARAKSDLVLESSLAKADKIQAESRKQAAHEKQQGELQWETDFREWLASDTARRDVAQLHWSAQQDRIESMRDLNESGLLNTASIQLPEPGRLVYLRFSNTDRRYQLLFNTIVSREIESPYVWQDTGFLAWIRLPQEQFSSSYWSLDTMIRSARRNVEATRHEQVVLYQGILNLSEDENLAGGFVKTSTLAMVPTSPSTQQSLSTVDRELWADAVDWMDLHGRMLGAAQRPDHGQLSFDQSIGWNLMMSPISVDNPEPQSNGRFFVNDPAQWGEFLEFADQGYGGIYQSKSHDAMNELLGKYQEHLGKQVDISRAKLLNRNSRFIVVGYPDKVIQRKGIVYWQHSLGVEPNRIDGVVRTNTVRTPIGRVDRQGWVNLPSGKRVLYSALRTWAHELTLGSSDQVNSLIDGMISPYVVDPNSTQYGIFIGGTGMHLFGMGNVERLYNLYQGTKFYYGGVGNPTEYDSFWNAYADNGSGYGWTAILDRIEADIVAHYRGHQKLHIFGWSRGAAMAIEFSRRLQRYQIEVHFLGLFDPVYSYILPGQSSSLIQWSPQGSVGNYVTGVPTRNVRSVGVIYAANEDRSFFPATRLHPGFSQRLKAMKSPGAHGEIGGHFLSNLIIQRLNMKAMMEFATKDAQAVFRDQGMEPDLVRVFASGLTRRLQLGTIKDPIAKLDARAKVELASKFDSWQAMDEEEYYRALVDCSLAKWKLGGFGFQSDNYSGLLAFGLEYANEFSPLGNMIFGLSDGILQQFPRTHYRRDLDWCPMELWDMEFLQDQQRSNRLTERHKEAIRKMYGLMIDPKTGDWID